MNYICFEIVHIELLQNYKGDVLIALIFILLWVAYCSFLWDVEEDYL